MRLLFLLTQDLERPSGLGRYWPLARQLAHLGYEVEIAALHSDWAGLSQRAFERDGVRISYVAQMHIRRQGAQVRYFGPLGLLGVTAAASLALARAALRSRAEIIHIAKAQPMNGLAGWLAARWPPRRRLYLDCDDYEAGSNRFSNGLQKTMVQWWEDHLPGATRGVTVNTNFTRQRCLSLGVPAERLRLVPNGFDPDRFKAAAPSATERVALRRRWGLDDGPIVLYLGSLSFSSHPVWLLLDAFEQVRQRLPAARLWLVGGGAEFDQLAAQIQTRGLQDHVTLTGRVDPAAAAAVYAASDVSVDPVLADDTARARSPLKIVESMACGIPVVTGDVGDRSDMLGHGAAGVLVAPGSAPALADGLVAVLSDETERRRLGGQALALSRAYAWDKLAPAFAEIYRL